MLPPIHYQSRSGTPAATSRLTFLTNPAQLKRADPPLPATGRHLPPTARATDDDRFPKYHESVRLPALARCFFNTHKEMKPCLPTPAAPAWPASPPVLHSPRPH